MVKSKIHLNNICLSIAAKPNPLMVLLILISFASCGQKASQPATPQPATQQPVTQPAQNPAPTAATQQTTKTVWWNYFNKYDMTDPAVLASDVLKKDLDYYFNNFISRSSKDAIKGIDYLMSIAPGQQHTTIFLFNYLHDRYKIPQIITDDEILIHLSDKHASEYIIPWFTETKYKELKDHVEKLRPLVMGNTAKEFRLDKIGGGQVALSDIKNKYTVLFFWSPDCEECTKEIPRLKEFQAEVKSKNLDVATVTICSEVGEFYQECVEGVKAKGLGEFINLGDKSGNSKVHDDYYANATPLVYILDQSKTIRLKKIPVNMLGTAINDLEKGTLNF